MLAVGTVSGQTRVQALNDAGWKALQARNAELAARLFAEALALRPNDPVLMFGAGSAAFLQGRTADALWRLRRALEFNPRLTEASRLLGEVTFDSGDVQTAIAIYERALRYAPNDAGLLSALTRWRKESAAHGAFTERTDQLFTILYEGRQEEAAAERATTILRAALAKITGTLGAPPPPAIFVVLYTEKQFRDMTGSPDWADALYDGRIRIPTLGAWENPVSFERMLTHELTHAIVWGLAPRGVPAWLQEGLAQYFEGRDPQAARRRVKGRGQPVSLTDLESSFLSKNVDDARFAYDVGLATVSLIVERAGFGWATFFSDLAEGTACESALIRRFGYSYGDLEAALAR
jgi:tetratricopeptide (TPR) repeat protein